MSQDPRISLLGSFMFCSEWSLVNHGELAIRAITLHCKAWSCPICLPIRKARLVGQVAAGLPTKLLTLTTRVVEDGDQVAEARRQGIACARLLVLIRKRFPGHKIAYFAVREATKQGWPHIHVALRSPFIEWVWLKEQWERLSGSPGIDIRAIYAAGNAAKYLAKYIGKDPHRFGTTKRYWYSRNWFDVLPETTFNSTDWDSKWHLVHETIGRLAEDAWMRRWEVEMHGSQGYFEARAPP